MAKEFLRILCRIVAFGTPAFITFTDLVGYVARIEGISMQPIINTDTTRTNDWVLVNRWGARNYHLKRGDIVSLRNPHRPGETIIKRIVALEGDTIKTLSYKVPLVKVPKGHCWVEGDHHEYSYDSNYFGPVALALVTAKISYIVWPPDRIKRLEVIACNDGRVT